MATRQQKKRRTLPPKGAGKLPEPLREFLDRCVVPALVEKYFAERKEKR